MKKFFKYISGISSQSLAWAFLGAMQMVAFFEIKHPASFLLAITGWCSIMWAIAREKHLD